MLEVTGMFEVLFVKFTPINRPGWGEPKMMVRHLRREPVDEKFKHSLERVSFAIHLETVLLTDRSKRCLRC